MIETDKNPKTLGDASMLLAAPLSILRRGKPGLVVATVWIGHLAWHAMPGFIFTQNFLHA